MYWYPPNKEISNVFDRLTRYPVVKVNPKIAQNISRCKKIRYLSYHDHINIRKGIISLPEETKLFKKGKCFDFKF